MITLKDALRDIKQKDYRDGRGHFSTVFMTCNRHKQKGGELIALDKAAKCGLPPNCHGHAMVGIKDLETGKDYAVHNYLIFQLDGKEVYWV